MFMRGILGFTAGLGERLESRLRRRMPRMHGCCLHRAILHLPQPFATIPPLTNHPPSSGMRNAFDFAESFVYSGKWEKVRVVFIGEPSMYRRLLSAVVAVPLLLAVDPASVLAQGKKNSKEDAKALAAQIDKIIYERLKKDK